MKPTGKPHVVAVIQARTGSSRLPGKVLRSILGKPMIEHQIERIRLATLVNEIVLATTTAPQDAPLLELGKRMGIGVYAGSENDVLDRMYQAAKRHKADIIVRLTADCPVIDPEIIDDFVRHLLDHREELDYVSVDATYAEGLDTEVMSMAALEQAWKEATKIYEREHVTVYIWQSGKFRFKRLPYKINLSANRWTVDEEKDFQLITALYEGLFPQFGYKFSVQDILNHLSKHPEMREINTGIVRNEGFLKSLRAERGSLVMKRAHPLTQSEAYWVKAKELIPAGTQTLSKGPTQFVEGVAPKYLRRGKGCHVWDVDGNEYIDYLMALGPIVLGYGYPATDDAIRAQLQDGITFTLMHPLEIEVAELLREHIPCAEKIRFGKNGSDVTTGAIRVARAYTGRDKVAHCGYHGWHDWYIASTTRNKGVPRSTAELQFGFTYNNLNSLKKIFDENPEQIAAVIMEPYGMTLPENNFLQKVKDLARAQGAVLIFDEVASGFRFHLGGVHQYFKVDPDLACFGKAMANGMPISALVGRSEVMSVLENDVFFSFTFGGECLSLAAAKATLQELKTQNVIPHIWEMGTRLKEGFNRLAMDHGVEQYVECAGLPPRSFVVFKSIGNTPSLTVKSLFQQEAIKRGILFSGAHMPTLSHQTRDIEQTLGAYQEVFEILAQAIREHSIERRLEGRVIQPVFRPVS